MLPALISGIAERSSELKKGRIYKSRRTSPLTPLPSGEGNQTSRSRQNLLSGELQDALGVLFVGIDARLHFVDYRLVDHQLPVVADVDFESIHRARRRPFEVKPADVVTGAVARTLELLLSLQPSRRAAQMSALGEDRVEARLGADDPGAKILLVFFTDFADHVVVGQAGLELRRRQEEHARERRADRGEQTDQREYAEASPSEHAQKIAAAPQRAELGFFLVAFRAFFCLLVLAPLLEFGGISRSFFLECNSHLSDATSHVETSLH